MCVKGVNFRKQCLAAKNRTVCSVLDNLVVTAVHSYLRLFWVLSVRRLVRLYFLLKKMLLFKTGESHDH